MVTSKQVILPLNTPTLLHTAIGRSELTVKSMSTVDTYVGSATSNLTINNGFKLNDSAAPSSSYKFTLSDGDSLYALAINAPGLVQVLVTT